MIDTAAAISVARDAASLGAMLAGASGGDSGGDFAGAMQQAREAAVELVSSAFIVPILERLHESPFQVEPFAPNFAEKRFAPLLDEKIADRIVGSANFKLVDAIVERLGARVTAARPTQEAIDAQG